MIFTRVRVRATLDERLVYIAQSSTAMMRIQILFLTDFSHRVDFNTTPYTGQYSQPVMVVAKRGSSFDPSWNRAGSRNSTVVRTPSSLGASRGASLGACFAPFNIQSMEHHMGRCSKALAMPRVEIL